MSAANHLFTWKKPYELKKTDWISFRKPLLDIIMVNNGVFSENEELPEYESCLVGFDEFLMDYGYGADDNTVYVDSSLYFTNSVDDYDTAQVLAVMLASSMRRSSALPETSVPRRSSSIRWLSVPPETRFMPRLTRPAASA